MNGGGIIELQEILAEWEFGEAAVLKVELTGDGLRDLALHLEGVRPQGDKSFDRARSGILTFRSVAYAKVERSPDFVLATHTWGPAAYTIVALREVQDRFGRPDLNNSEWKAYQLTLDDWDLVWKQRWLSVICRDLRFELSD